MNPPARPHARIAAVCLLTLLVVEAVLQAAFLHLPQPLITRMPQYRLRAGFQLDTEHGAREYPAGQLAHIEITAQSGDLYTLTCLSRADAQPMDSYRVQYKRDSHGFRNEEPWSDSPQLVVIGDSFTAAESIVSPYWEGATESVLALGLPGSGTLEQHRLFDALALPRQPDSVVLAYFAGNDISDSRVYYNLQASGRTYAQLEADGKQLWDYSALFHLAQLIRESLARDTDSDCIYPLVAATDPPTPLAFYDEFLPALALDKGALQNDEVFAQMAASIRDMASATKAYGGRFALLYIPQKAELHWQYLGSEDRARLSELASAPIDEGSLSAQRDMLRELADEIGIAFIDASVPLAAAIAKGQSPYFFADTHWNQLGHNIARIALSDFVNQTSLVP